MTLAQRLLENKQTKRKLLPNVRNKALIELGIVYFAIFYDDNAELTKAISKRVWAKKQMPNKSGIAFELEPADIIPLLGCSERRAKEIIPILRTVTL